MKIRIERGEAARALKRVMGASDARSDKTYLAGVLMEASDGYLTLSATDLDVSAQTVLQCDVLEEGRVSTPVKALYEALHRMDESDVDLALNESRLSVRAGSVNCRLLTEDSSLFPKLFFDDAEFGVGLEAEEFARVLVNGGYCPSRDDDRPNLTGVHLVRTAHDRVTVESTDGHRAARVVSVLDAWDHENETFLDDGLTIPSRGLRVIGDLIDSQGAPVNIGMSSGQVVISQGATKVAMRPVGGGFPDIGAVLPDIATWSSCLCKRDVFLSALDLSRLFTPKSDKLRLTFADDGLGLYATNPDLGESNQVIPCEWSGEERVSVGMSWRYIADALKHIQGREVAIWLSDEDPRLSPMVCMDPEDQDVTHIVMPMRS